MKNLYTALLFSCFITSAANAQTAFCNPNGNVVIYSNYDGGDITINCDQNIPNLKIGIVSYEFSRIHITGTYAGNVTEVRWAGYNGTNNHCSLSTPYTTSITGVANNVDTIIVMPPNSYANANGYNLIICNYSCDNTTNQGGCNTPDQIVDYFMSNFGGTLYYHFTQYGCWSGTYNVSSGGNCCIVPTTLGIASSPQPSMNISNDQVTETINVGLSGAAANGKLEIFDMSGRMISSFAVNAGELLTTISAAQFDAGTYIIRYSNDETSVVKRFVISR